jgi:N-acyl-D-amino-acid deacylase
MYGLLFRNARIADGLGNALIEGGLAVKGGRIAAEIGRVREDAAGKRSMPRTCYWLLVIDLHTHYDAQLTWDKSASPSPALGVAIVVIGNCGFGIAPTPGPRSC